MGLLVLTLTVEVMPLISLARECGLFNQLVIQEWSRSGRTDHWCTQSSSAISGLRLSRRALPIPTQDGLISFVVCGMFRSSGAGPFHGLQTAGMAYPPDPQSQFSR